MTISAEQRAHIRRLFFAEHWKVGTIAAEFDVHADTVKNAIGSDTFVSCGPRSRQSLLDPFKPFIVETLKQYPRLRATRLFDMLAGRGFEGSARQLRRYVSKVRPTRKREAYLLTRTMAGEQGQMDWGHFGSIDVPGGKRRLSLFVMALAYSRMLFAHFTLDQRMDSFLHCHRLAFESFDGVPRQILYDNLKSVVTQRSGQHVQFHPSVLDLAGHYHFVPRPCHPYRPNEKGVVERAIQTIRGGFFEARSFRDVTDLNEQLQDWVACRVMQRVHPSDDRRRTIGEMFYGEQPLLLPLPEHAPPTARIESKRSGKRPYLRFDCNDYSIPHALVRKPLTLIADHVTVRVADGEHIVATHARSHGKRQVIETAAHIDALVTQKKRATELRGRDRLRALCPHADALLEVLAARNEPIRQRTTRLNQLLATYGAEALEAAIVRALQSGAPAVGSIAYLLDQERHRDRRPVPIDVEVSAHVRDKDVIVVPHDMRTYDVLECEPSVPKSDETGDPPHDADPSGDLEQSAP